MGTNGGSEHGSFGLYEQLHTRRWQLHLENASEISAAFAAIPSDEAPEVLAQHIADKVRDALVAADPDKRVEMTNSILSGISEDLVEPGPTQLLSLFPPDSLKRLQHRRPSTPLRKPALLTNGKDDPNLAAELRAEMGSANRVELLCAFIRWTGLRLLEPALEDARDRGIPIRVITSTYMGGHGTASDR